MEHLVFVKSRVVFSHLASIHFCECDTLTLSFLLSTSLSAEIGSNSKVVLVALSSCSGGVKTNLSRLEGNTMSGRCGRPNSPSNLEYHCPMSAEPTCGQNAGYRSPPLLLLLVEYDSLRGVYGPWAKGEGILLRWTHGGNRRRGHGGQAQHQAHESRAPSSCFAFKAGRRS